MSRVFDNGSIPGRAIPKTQTMVLEAALLNTQYYKVLIKGMEYRPSLYLAIEKGSFGSPSTKFANFT